MEPLKAVLDSLDAVDEALRPLYEQRDEKFFLRLAPDSVRDHPAVKPLTNAFERVKKDHDATKGQLAAANGRLENVPDDFDASLYSRLIAEDAARKENPDQAEKQLQSQREMYEERLRKAAETARGNLAERDRTNADLQQKIDARDKDQALDNALASVGIQRHFLAAVRALMRPNVKLDPTNEIDGRPETYFDTDMGRQSVAQYLQNWVQTEAGKHYVEPASGGDAGSTSTARPTTTQSADNPWRTDGGRRPNLTRQQEFIRTNPNLAKRLAAQAGVDLKI